jgi:hypothetical protein
MNRLQQLLSEVNLINKSKRAKWFYKTIYDMFEQIEKNQGSIFVKGMLSVIINEYSDIKKTDSLCKGQPSEVKKCEQN